MRKTKEAESQAQAEMRKMWFKTQNKKQDKSHFSPFITRFHFYFTLN